MTHPNTKLAANSSKHPAPLRLLFTETVMAIKGRQQDVTRRYGMGHLKPGDLIEAVLEGWQVNCPIPVLPLATLEVVAVTEEPVRRLSDEPAYGAAELVREGYPANFTPQRRILNMLTKHKTLTLDSCVTRIEFRYVG